MTPRQNCSGCFLIASPYLTDGHFFRSVTLVIRHSADGAFGLVINRPGAHRFSEMIAMSDPSWNVASPTQGTANLTIPRDQIHIGGPVAGPLLVLHDIAGIGEPCGTAEGVQDNSGLSAEVHDHPGEDFGSMSLQWADVPAWVTSDEDHLRLLARRDDARLKFVVNYSGWGPGQLDHELEVGGWLVTPADTENIFATDDELWQRMVKRCGQAILQQLTPDIRLPDANQKFDPGWN